MAKDRPFIKFYTSCFMAETSGMNDEELGKHIRIALRSWAFNDIDHMPDWMLLAKSDADIKSEQYRKNKMGAIDKDCEPLLSIDKDCEPLPISSSLLSSNSSSSSRLEDKTEGVQRERIDEVVSSCGIPKWAQQVGAVSNGLRKATSDGIPIDREQIIKGIRNYAKKIIAENPDVRWIADVDNWLGSGQWVKYQADPVATPTTEPKKEPTFMEKWNAQKAIYNR